MRLSWTEDEAFPGQFALWQANCRRSLESKRGQAALRELEAALLALPVPELVGSALETPERGVCAIGALARYKAIDVSSDADQLRHSLNEDDDYEAQAIMEGVADACGVPPMVAWKTIEINDIDCDGMTPAQRHQRVLRWVRSQIIREAVTA